MTFAEPGALGLKFQSNEQTGHAEVVKVNPGTQAEHHAPLRPGLILRRVGPDAVAGRPYAEVLGLTKASPRPVSLQFVPGGTLVSQVGRLAEELTKEKLHDWHQAKELFLCPQ